MDEYATEVAGVDEGECGEGVGNEDQDAAGDGEGTFLLLGDFVADSPDHQEDEGTGEEEVACGFGGFLVVVDGIGNGLGC